jgi:hypothetical protein
LFDIDPLSLTASIAALIALADTVVTRGTKYYRSVREQPKQVSALVGEIAALSGVLSALRRIVEQKEITLDLENTEKNDYREGSALQQLKRGNSQSDIRPAAIPPGVVREMEPILLQSCQQTLEQCRDILAKMESRPEEPIMNTAKRLRWPFLESEISDILAKIERYKSSFQLAISVDNM